MPFNKSVCVVSVGALVGALVYGCSSSSSSPAPGGDDAGVTVDSSVHDAPADSPKADSSKNDGQALTCAPIDVSTFMPPPFKPVHQQVGACTNQNIADFTTNCLNVGHTKAMCDAYKMANATCAGCLETNSTAATWGAAYFHTSTAPGSTLGVITANVGGCFEILGGAAGLDCSKKMQVAETCETAACDSVCQITDDASFQLYVACLQQAAGAGCSTAAQASAGCQQALTMGDGGATACTGGTDFQSIFDLIAPVICGGASTDAGGGG